MKSQSKCPLILRFFDLEFSFSSSDLSILRPFQVLYSAFQPKNATGPPSHFMRVELDSLDSIAGDRSLIIDGQRWPVSEPMCRSGALYEFLLKGIYERIRSHILIHSSALSLDGGGVLLVGDSGFGKSTLALSLANRGAGFFSDEVGAIDRESGYLEAFPRRMRVHDKSLKLAGLDTREIPLNSWFGKRLLDVECIREGIIAAPSPIRAVVFLSDCRELDGGIHRRDSSVIEFLLDRCDAELVEFASELNGVCEVERDDSDAFVTMRLKGENLGIAAAELESQCRDRRICVLDAASPVRIEPDFSVQPRLVSIDAKRAFGRLMQQYLPGRGSLILREEYAGKSTRLLLEMMRLLDGVAFFELAVGEMQQTLKLIESMTASLGRLGEGKNTKL